jgi:hypothetical protein
MQNAELIETLHQHFSGGTSSEDSFESSESDNSVDISELPKESLSIKTPAKVSSQAEIPQTVILQPPIMLTD